MRSLRGVRRARVVAGDRGRRNVGGSRGRRDGRTDGRRRGRRPTRRPLAVRREEGIGRGQLLARPFPERRQHVCRGRERVQPSSWLQRRFTQAALGQIVLVRRRGRGGDVVPGFLRGRRRQGGLAHTGAASVASTAWEARRAVQVEGGDLPSAAESPDKFDEGAQVVLCPSQGVQPVRRRDDQLRDRLFAVPTCAAGLLEEVDEDPYRNPSGEPKPPSPVTVNREVQY